MYGLLQDSSSVVLNFSWSAYALFCMKRHEIEGEQKSLSVNKIDGFGMSMWISNSVDIV